MLWKKKKMRSGSKIRKFLSNTSKWSQERSKHKTKSIDYDFEEVLMKQAYCKNDAIKPSWINHPIFRGINGSIFQKQPDCHEITQGCNEYKGPWQRSCSIRIARFRMSLFAEICHLHLNIAIYSQHFCYLSYKSYNLGYQDFSWKHTKTRIDYDTTTMLRIHSMLPVTTITSEF
jgi:hypothetical protein